MHPLPQDESQVNPLGASEGKNMANKTDNDGVFHTDHPGPPENIYRLCDDGFAAQLHRKYL